MPLTTCLSALGQAGRPLADLVMAVPARLRLTVVGECAALGPVVGDDLLEAMWRVEPLAEVLAAAALLAPAMPVSRAMEWSIRLRGNGLGVECPLMRLAADPGRSARDRTLAAACGHEHFGDERAMELLEAALSDVDDAGVLAELAVLAPGISAAIEPAELSARYLVRQQLTQPFEQKARRREA